ncbi:MAG TPA: hypothetical protein VJZ69_00830 [Clostridia bacterium]|nr:hypothetical protein [Clostridia bacterium]
MRKTKALGLIFLMTLCSLICVSNVTFAYTPEPNFELIYPLENYYQFSENSVMSANNSTVAIFNPTKHSITVFSDTTCILPCDTANSLILFGNYLFAENANGYEQFELSTKTSLGQAALDSAPANFKLYANGNMLFAVNDFGAMQSYDTNLTAISSDNSTVLLDSTLAVKDSMIYAIDYSNSINKFVLQSLDTSYTPCVVEDVLERDENYTHLAVGDYICIAYSRENSTTLSVYTSGGASMITQTLNFQINTMTASGNSLFLLDEPTSSLYCYKFVLEGENLSLVFEKAITKSSNDNSHLSSASDIAVDGNKKYVADYGNNRLVTLTQNGGTTEITSLTLTSPQSLALSSNGVYVATQNKIVFVYNGIIVNEYSLAVSSPILSIAKTDKIYALAGNKIYVLSDYTFKEFKTVENAKKIAASSNGNIIYALTSTGIKAFTENGDDISTEITFTENYIADFDIDYVGNLYTVSTSGRIFEYTRGLASYTLSQNISLTHELVSKGTPTALSIGSDGKLYFSSGESFVASVSLFTPATASSFTPTVTPQITVLTEIFTAKLNKNSFFLLDPKNYEYVESINFDNVVVCFRNLSADSNFVYVIHGSKIGYISFLDLLEVAEMVPATVKVKTLHPTSKIYQYPLNREGTQTTSVPKGTELEIIGDVAQFSNPLKWYKVKYNIDQIGYIFVTDVTDSNDAVLTSGSPVYGKAKASRIGELVSIYALPDSLSSVLEMVTDGTELQVLDDSTYEGFTKVKSGSIVGYVKSSEIKIGGLTHAQIIALILVCVTAVVAVIIFFITNKLRKQAE